MVSSAYQLWSISDIQFALRITPQPKKTFKMIQSMGYKIGMKISQLDTTHPMIIQYVEDCIMHT